MAKININCPNCQSWFKVDEAYLGKSQLIGTRWQHHTWRFFLPYTVLMDLMELDEMENQYGMKKISISYLRICSIMVMAGYGRKVSEKNLRK